MVRYLDYVRQGIEIGNKGGSDRRGSDKDSDKAIADRAEWRADERRWCREGKLPQPG